MEGSLLSSSSHNFFVCNPIKMELTDREKRARIIKCKTAEDVVSLMKTFTGIMEDLIEHDELSLKDKEQYLFEILKKKKIEDVHIITSFANSVSLYFSLMMSSRNSKITLNLLTLETLQINCVRNETMKVKESQQMTKKCHNTDRIAELLKHQLLIKAL